MFDLSWANLKLWERYTRPFSPPPFFSSIVKQIDSTTFVLWEEHCVECSAPACYKTCPLYRVRKDQACRRFYYGIIPNRNFTGLYNFGADISFAKWAKLWTYWPATTQPAMHSLKEQRFWASLDIFIINCLKLVNKVSYFFDKKCRINLLHYKLRRLVQKKFLTKKDSCLPDGFFLQIYNPSQQPFTILLEAMHTITVFKKAIEIKPGWNEEFIPYAEFRFEEKKEGRVFLWVPSNEPTRMIITWLDFVFFKKTTAEIEATKSSETKVKCVAWDLDNTLWHGVIGDDGAENVSINYKAVSIIKQLDERGILNTVVSKNNYDVAWKKIESLGLAEYFLYPAINWGPKSENIKQIAKELNIGIDTFAIIDDSVFERNEVTDQLKIVRAYDPADLDGLLGRSEFIVPITEMSRKRRSTYLTDYTRKQILANWKEDYDSFLKSCAIKLQISNVKNENYKQRCLELLQRTNQLNLSGNKYTTEEFESLLVDPALDSYCLKVSDKFGDYGIVGFATINHANTNPIMTNFVLSCRVAQKKIEQSFFSWLVQKYKATGSSRMGLLFRPTGRNQPLKDELDKLKLELIKEEGGQQLLVLTELSTLASGLVAIEE